MNQLNFQEYQQIEKLKKFYGLWFVRSNSPEIIKLDWISTISIVGPVVCTEDGGIDRAEIEALNRAGEQRRYLQDLNEDTKFCMVYCEQPDTQFYDVDVNRYYKECGGKRIITLCRNFAGKYKRAVRQNLKNKYCGGICFELKASAQWVNQIDLKRGISEVIRAGKRCFVILTPQHPSVNYKADVKSAITALKTSVHWTSDKLYIVLACYEKENTGIGFLGGDNSIEGALELFK